MVDFKHVLYNYVMLNQLFGDQTQLWGYDWSIKFYQQTISQ